jgi:hypothetical protein
MFARPRRASTRPERAKSLSIRHALRVLREEQCSRCGLLNRLQAVLESECVGTLTCRLQQTQLAGTCDRFGAPLDLELAKDFPIVSFHRVQGEEQPLAHLLIGESLSHEVEDF